MILRFRNNVLNSLSNGNIQVMFEMHTLKNCVHLNQSIITVYAFGDTNVIVCYVWLIASHLKCDVIEFACSSCIQLTKLVLFSSILDKM